MTKTHEIKCYPEYFRELSIGTKTFEICKNDRDYTVGDRLLVKEWDGLNKYSGFEIEFVITNILDTFYTKDDGQILKEGYVIMSIKEIQ